MGEFSRILCNDNWRSEESSFVTDCIIPKKPDSLGVKTHKQPSEDKIYINLYQSGIFTVPDPVIKNYKNFQLTGV